jgi:hypothetical protein
MSNVSSGVRGDSHSASRTRQSGTSTCPSHAFSCRLRLIAAVSGTLPIAYSDWRVASGMGIRAVTRKGGLLLAWLGNLAILATPVAHGYVHSEAAHHAAVDHHAATAAAVGPRVSEVEAPNHDGDHEHPNLTAAVSSRGTLWFIAAVPAQVFADARITANASSNPREREARARRRPTQASPPQLRAPPTV